MIRGRGSRRSYRKKKRLTARAEFEPRRNISEISAGDQKLAKVD
jgi:hypothetical protein